MDRQKETFEFRAIKNNMYIIYIYIVGINKKLIRLTVACTAFGEPIEMQSSWQVQPFVNHEMQILRQAQRFAHLGVQISQQ